MLAGAAFIMAAALQNSYTAIYMGLVQAVPDVNLLELNWIATYYWYQRVCAATH